MVQKMKAIFARNLSKTYWFYEKEAGLSGALKALFRGRKVFVEAVRGINLNVEVGETIGFIGPNGAGKTTTLKMLTGILHPTHGYVEVMGYGPFKREKPFLRSITFITGQRDRLFWDLPAREFFHFCKVIYEIPENVYRRNLKDLVELAEIGDILSIPQRKLSFGQRRRCELVAALLHDPGVVFLDEPTNGLDLLNARKIREFIREKGRGPCTIILTSHNISDISQVCDRVVIINQGKITFDGSLGHLNRMRGLKKQVKVVFKDPFRFDAIEKMGEVIERHSRELLLEIEHDSVASVMSLLLDRFPVEDIEIKDPPLEKMIEAIYLGKSI
jgi:ABC-2 type transport system ATP-binding protein